MGARITRIQAIIICASVTICLLTWATLRLTSAGRRIRALANDPYLSTIVGVDTDRIILLVFMIGSGIAGAAAILISLDTDITPTMGFTALLMGVVAAIVGGVGNISGAIVGGLFVGLAQHLGVWKLPTEWQDAIVFAILIAFLLARPQGFLGKPMRRAGI